MCGEILGKGKGLTGGQTSQVMTYLYLADIFTIGE